MANMPGLKAKGLSVRMVTADLTATTPEPATATSLQQANLQTVSSTFKNGSTLAEKHFELDPDGCSLHYLKPDNEFPFSLVGPGRIFDDIEGAAFSITVFLSPRCFGSKYRPTKNDIKIDVYVNGDLCGSHFVPNRVGGEHHIDKEQTVRFTGRRVGANLEKPFVVVGSSSYVGKGKQKALDVDAANNEVWDTVSGLLLSQAKAKTYLGRYLTSVANTPMPPELKQSQDKNEDEKISPRTSPYSIVDVVITAGKGAKDQSGQGALIKAPTPLRLEEIEETTQPKPAEVLTREFKQKLNNPGHGTESTLSPEAAITAWPTSATAHTPNVEATTATPDVLSSDNAIPSSSDATPQTAGPTSSSPAATSSSNAKNATPDSNAASSSSSAATPSSNATTATPAGNAAPLTRTLPRAQAGKKPPIPHDQRAALSRAELIKHRWMMPATFIPPPVSGYEVHHSARTRSQMRPSTATTPQGPAPTAIMTQQAPAPTAIMIAPSATPTAASKTFTGPSSGFVAHNTNKRGYADVFDTHQTAEEQMASIATAAKKTVLETRAHSTPNPKSLTVVLKVDFSKLRIELTTSLASSGLSSAPSDDSSSFSSDEDSMPPPNKRHKASGEEPRRELMSAEEIASQEATFEPQIPGMGCYAEKGVVRQAKAQRGGWFKEQEVVYGCRLLI